MKGDYARVGDADGFHPFFTSAVLGSMGVVPYGILAVDAAYAYGSVGVAWGLWVAMLAGCGLRWAWCRFGWMERGDGLVGMLDRFAFAVVMCNAMAWPWMWAGSTVATVFLSLALVRLARRSKGAVAVAGAIVLVVAVLLCSVVGVPVVERMESRWVSDGGFAAFPAVLLPVLAATRSGAVDCGGIAEVGMEALWVVLLFVASGRLTGASVEASGVHFASFPIEAGLGSDACRVLAYLGLVVVVFGTMVGVVEKKKERWATIMDVERAVLCQGWASLILLPLLSLSPLVVFPLAVLIIRAVGIWVVYKGF